MPGHGGGDVTVEVERDRDREVGSDGATDGGQQLALAVVRGLRHHRPVEVEEDAVDGAGRRQVGEEAVADVTVDVAGDGTGRRRGGGDGGQERDPVALGGCQHATQAGAGAAVDLEDLAAVAQVPRLELAAVGRDVAERVRLVGEHREEEAHATGLPFTRRSSV